MKFLSVTIPIKALYKVCMVVLSTESVDEILKCKYWGYSYQAVFSRRNVNHAVQGGLDFWFQLKFDVPCFHVVTFVLCPILQLKKKQLLLSEVTSQYSIRVIWPAFYQPSAF